MAKYVPGKYIFWNLVWIIPAILVYLTVVNSKGCDQLVIDTYEIHSGIDIPQVSSLGCYYDEDSGVRQWRAFVTRATYCN